MTAPTHLLRYEDTAGSVYLNRCRVLSETPKGLWIDNYGKRKFVLNEGRKRFAWETKELAKISFLARKQRQLGYLHAQIENVNKAFAAMVRDEANEAYYEFTL